MCTIIVAIDHFDAARTVVAANRDELYARPSTGGRLIETAPRAVGGVDLERGGTWMGLNEQGLFVGVTNLGPPRAGRRSRGELVRAALRLSEPDHVDALLHREASGDAYNPFNLVYGCASDIRVAHSPDDDLSIVQLPSGLHVIASSGPPDDPKQPKAERARLLTADIALDSGPTALESALLEVLADDVRPELASVEPLLERFPGLDPERVRALQSIWVRTPRYGTRSSTIAMLSLADRQRDETLADATPSRYTFVPGDPDAGPSDERQRLEPRLWSHDDDPSEPIDAAEVVSR